MLLLSLFHVRCSSVATTKLDKNAIMDELSMENPGESFYLTVEYSCVDKLGKSSWYGEPVVVGLTAHAHTQKTSQLQHRWICSLSKSLLLSVIPPGSTATPALITITSRGDIAPGRK